MINFGIDIVEVTQVAFPATAIPSADPNTLDDYEEGEWLVTVTASTSGTCTLNAVQDTGAYTKIGRVVHVQAFLRIGTKTVPVGDFRISLPFAISNTLTDEADSACGSFSASGFDLTGLYLDVYGTPGGAFFVVHEIKDDAAWASIPWTAVSDGDYFRFSFSYITDE